MKTNTSWKRLMSVIGLGVALSGVPAYPTGNEASAASPAVSAAPQTEASDAVTEWNLHAVSFTLTATPPLSPVQQTRVMAIIQLAVHDAVNGITGKYATYLSPSAAPEGASPDAAAIAASHHALSSLFASHASTLDTLFMESLAAHGLSEDDPGIEYGRSAAAAILALRANDNSGQAQFEYDAP
ncbi:MAG TPA: hypothetical protein VFQ92_10890, partial [Blastocatellia bacterium]|nr:hypothetical protein [Blastocatellia bacterium]